jgi:drug/metabolite transporter (DMT)-like permease
LKQTPTQFKAVFAYICVVLVWSTTPLTIQWSQDSFTSIQALFWRMFFAWVLVLLFLTASQNLPKISLPSALLFTISGGGLFIAMALIYSAAPFIDTGLVAIIHGLLPLFTAVFAFLILKSQLKLVQWLSLLVSFIGMIILFRTEMQSGFNVSLAFGSVLMAVIVHSLTAVLIKRHAVSVPVSHQLLGALTVTSSCLFFWLLITGEAFLPSQLSFKSVSSILYLAVVGSVCGFFFYYYLLKQVSPVTVGTITLITPVLSMAIGSFLNQESFPLGTIIGTAILLMGLCGYLFRSHKQ